MDVFLFFCITTTISRAITLCCICFIFKLNRMSWFVVKKKTKKQKTLTSLPLGWDWGFRARKMLLWFFFSMTWCLFFFFFFLRAVAFEKCLALCLLRARISSGRVKYRNRKRRTRPSSASITGRMEEVIERAIESCHCLQPYPCVGYEIQLWSLWDRGSILWISWLHEGSLALVCSLSFSLACKSCSYFFI